MVFHFLDITNLCNQVLLFALTIESLGMKSNAHLNFLFFFFGLYSLHTDGYVLSSCFYMHLVATVEPLCYGGMSLKE
jgi:hypothetical protein